MGSKEVKMTLFWKHKAEGKWKAQNLEKLEAPQCFSPKQHLDNNPPYPGGHEDETWGLISPLDKQSRQH